MSLVHFSLNQTSFVGVLKDATENPVRSLMGCTFSIACRGGECPPQLCMWLFRHAFHTSHDPRIREGAMHELLALSKSATLTWTPSAGNFLDAFFSESNNCANVSNAVRWLAYGACELEKMRKYQVLAALCALMLDSSFDYRLHLYLEFRQALKRHFGAEETSSEALELCRQHLATIVPSLSWTCHVHVERQTCNRALPKISVIAVTADSHDVSLSHKSAAPSMVRLITSLGNHALVSAPGADYALNLLTGIKMDLAVSTLKAYDIHFDKGISFDTVGTCYDLIFDRISEAYNNDDLRIRGINSQDYHGWFYCCESLFHIFQTLLALARACPDKKLSKNAVDYGSRIISLKLQRTLGALQLRMSKAYRYLANVLQFQIKPFIGYDKRMGRDVGQKGQTSLNKWLTPSPRKATKKMLE